MKLFLDENYVYDTLCKINYNVLLYGKNNSGFTLLGEDSALKNQFKNTNNIDIYQYTSSGNGIMFLLIGENAERCEFHSPDIDFYEKIISPNCKKILIPITQITALGSTGENNSENSNKIINKPEKSTNNS